MKASKIIDKLTSIISEHGDIEVVVNSAGHDNPYSAYVCIAYKDNENDLWIDEEDLDSSDVSDIEKMIKIGGY